MQPSAEMKATQDLARRGTLYPAVILHGGREEERRDLALALARTLLCEESVEARPCGRCKHCRRIVWPGGKQDLFHPDFMVLERDLRTSTSVDAARTLLQAAQVSPFESRSRAYAVTSPGPRLRITAVVTFAGIVLGISSTAYPPTLRSLALTRVPDASRSSMWTFALLPLVS